MSKGKATGDLITIPDFREFIFHRLVPVEDVEGLLGEGIVRSLPYWRRNELLPFIPKGKWIKFSFAQLLWLRLLDTLRLFNYSLENIVRSCDYFFRDAAIDGLPIRNLEAGRQLLQKRKLARTMDDGDKESLSFIENLLGDEAQLHILRYDINYLTQFVIQCLEEGFDGGLLFFGDGKVGEYGEAGYQSHRGETVNPREPHLFLSLSYLLEPFIEEGELAELLLPQLLSLDEKRVLREIRHKNVREIRIFKTGNETVPYRIESSSSKVISGDEAQEIRKILGMGNYERIELKTIDKNSFEFKKTRRNR
ncbi:MAG: hypothetical protein JWP69_242 [Flaviaesturariibacter sp.]|nr:hypothetical protein [Flaviaesturariibacter sp.]